MTKMKGVNEMIANFKSFLIDMDMKKIIVLSIIIVCVVVIVFLKISGRKPDSAFELYTMMITQKEKIAKLTTLKFSEDMLLAVTDESQDTVALILAHPYLRLGFDLKDLKKEDVFERNDTIFVCLPPAIITHCGCNPKDRELIFDNTSRKTDWDEEIKKLMVLAEERIKASAANQHLFERAANNAVELLYKLFSFDDKKTVCVTVAPANIGIQPSNVE